MQDEIAKPKRSILLVKIKWIASEKTDVRNKVIGSMRLTTQPRV